MANILSINQAARAHCPGTTGAGMTSEDKPQGQHKLYQIKVQGHLGSEWTDWFEGLHVTPQENGETLLSGPVRDQAALHGLLKKVRDLGIPLVSVNLVDHPVNPKSGDTHNIQENSKGGDGRD